MSVANMAFDLAAYCGLVKAGDRQGAVEQLRRKNDVPLVQQVAV